MRNRVEIVFLKTGLLTLYQDQGRIGKQSLGLPRGGYLDERAAQMANWLVGNSLTNPVIEITLLGPVLSIHGPCQIAITGANLSPTLNGQAIPLYETLSIQGTNTLRFGKNKGGCRCYLAIGGEWALKRWEGSVGLLAASGTPPGLVDQVAKDAVFQVETRASISQRRIPESERPDWDNSIPFRVIVGPELERFSSYHTALFFSKSHRVSPQSNRMGYFLDTQLTHYKVTEPLISSGVIPGTIQINNTGNPMILMADAQTIGGYYRIATIIRTDLSRLGQIKPGEYISFELINVEEAIQLQKEALRSHWNSDLRKNP